MNTKPLFSLLVTAFICLFWLSACCVESVPMPTKVVLEECDDNFNHSYRDIGINPAALPRLHALAIKEQQRRETIRRRKMMVRPAGERFYTRYHLTLLDENDAPIESFMLFKHAPFTVEPYYKDPYHFRADVDTPTQKLLLQLIPEWNNPGRPEVAP